MNRKNLLLLAVIIAGTLAIMAGCTSPQFGAPGTTGTAITGRVATPESCFSDACDNPSITEGKPLPGATALFYGGDSGKLKIEGETGCDGAFEVNTTGEGSYVLYVVREYPEGSGKYVVVKKGVNNPRGDIGEANAYTTSQVIIWERANALYGEDFTPFDASWYAQYDWKWSFAPAKLVLPVSEIPNLEPSTQLLAAVEEALSECRDPQEDDKVIFFADQIADATFGAPAGGGAAGGGGGGAANRSFTVTKTVDKNSISVGETANYTVVVTNTGNQSLSPTVSDDKFTLPAPKESGNSNGTLNVGETWTYKYSYTPEEVPTPNPLVNTVTVTVPGLTSQTAQASVEVNTYTPPTPTATITVVKKVVNGEDGTWSFTGGLGKFRLTTSGGTASTTYPVTPGQSYTITETTKDNWTTKYAINDGTAGDDNSATVNVPTDGGDLVVTFTNTYTAGTISGKVCQHNGNGYGKAVAHFRDITGCVYDVETYKNGEFSITLPAGSYVFWADKETGNKWYTSIGYNPDSGPKGVQCITLNPGDEITNASIWIQNSGGPGVTPRPTPHPDSCL